jgi:hypothetical protein
MLTLESSLICAGKVKFNQNNPSKTVVVLTDYGTSNAEIFAPRLRRPTAEKRLKTDLRLAVKTIVAEQAVVRRQRENDLCRPSDEPAAGLLGLDGTEQSEQVGKHHAVSKLRPIIDAVDLSAVLGHRSEGQDVVKVKPKTFVFLVRVNVLDECLDVLQNCYCC